MNLSFKTVSPLVITFMVLTVLITAAWFGYADKGIDYPVVLGSNVLFFLVSLFVFNMQFRAMHNSNPNVFIRSVMSGMIIKVFVCVIAVVAYYFLSKAAFNKPAVYAAMVIYIVYLVVEVRTVMKLNKSKHA
jgi:hypothetical protein